MFVVFGVVGDVGQCQVVDVMFGVFVVWFGLVVVGDGYVDQLWVCCFQCFVVDVEFVYYFWMELFEDDVVFVYQFQYYFVCVLLFQVEVDGMFVVVQVGMVG